MGKPSAASAATAWLELTVECDTEAVEPVSELFARYGFNQGVVIEEPFTQEPDGDNLAVDRSRPVASAPSSPPPMSTRTRSRRFGAPSGRSGTCATSAIWR